ncbi:GAF domain-containing protein [Nocardia sp. ET3-3]|uniref:GAF domain-containing protein n=1 Tax=Nocardia terrae TaxID=2675851 RepID=A0A7K1USH8_9NOCA|nr:GAF domain-containing protein [Nocardia terrae]MVU77297.1 GAF domain-containing protein [Nocardia terrae]
MRTPPRHPSTPKATADRTLESVAALVSRGLSGRPMVGISAYADGELTALDWSSPRAKLLEEAPMLCPLSPCRAAIRFDRTILVADITLESRWVDYAFEVKPLGVRSMLCEPVRRAGTVIGVLTVYGEGCNGFGPADHDAFESAVAQTADLLVAHRTRADR